MLARLLVLQAVQQAAVAAHRVKPQQQNSILAPAANSKQYSRTLSPSPRMLASLTAVQAAVPVEKMAHFCNISLMGRPRWSHSSKLATSQAARAARNQPAVVAVAVAAVAL
jgi:hypothetical protein